MKSGPYCRPRPADPQNLRLRNHRSRREARSASSSGCTYAAAPRERWRHDDDDDDDDEEEGKKKKRVERGRYLSIHRKGEALRSRLYSFSFCRNLWSRSRSGCSGHAGIEKGPIRLPCITDPPAGVAWRGVALRCWPRQRAKKKAKKASALRSSVANGRVQA